MQRTLLFMLAVVGALFLAVLLTRSASAVVANLTPAKDNTLVEDATGSVSDGAGSWFFAGKTNEGKNGKIRRALLQFDLSAIPSTATVTNVTLTLSNDRGKAGSYAIALHRVLTSWGEGTSNSDANPGKGAASTTNDATWIHRFYPTLSWSAAGGDFDAAVSASTTVGNTGTYVWSGSQMIADVQLWVSTPASNFGWLLQGSETSKQTTRRFMSRTGGTPPMLQVTYVTAVVNGACCSPDNTCQVLTSSQCASAGGTYQGDGTVCSPNPCQAPTGACCLSNGTCTTGTESQCAAAGGTYQGNGSLCTAGLCPVVLTPFLDPLPIPAVLSPTSGSPGGAASYQVAITEFNQQLHHQLPATRVWGYAGSYPGPTIEASTDQPVTVTWLNDLRDTTGALRTTHYLPVDTCLSGPSTEGPTPRLVTHLHGGHVPPEADGYPMTTNLPGEQTTDVYPNHQSGATLWYHDHAMGITRLNVMMGLAGFYLLRDSLEKSLPLPAGPYEVALAIQDRSFNPDGSLQYPAEWMEHFFGDKVLVNGKVWPYFNVKRGKYRFRLLDGSNSRTYTLALSNGAPFWVLGEDGGLLAAPVRRDTLTITPGERRDVVIDFQPYAAGTEIVLQNSAPAPYPGSPGVGVIPNVMKFVVGDTAGAYTTPLPTSLRQVEALPESTADRTRSFVLSKIGADCDGQMWTINGLGFDDVTENPELGSTEIWSFINQSGYVHPMHMHLVQFRVLDRQPFVVDADTILTTGPRVPPDSSEAGWRDTAPVRPYEILRVITQFTDYTGRYVYHCHVLEHEDHEMMRQFEVVPPASVGRKSEAAGVRLAQSYPNPATGPVRIAYTLPTESRVRLVVEDVAGRQVRILVDQRLLPGPHVAAWDGRDLDGGSAAPGVYFYRLMVDGRSPVARRLVLLR